MSSYSPAEPLLLTSVLLLTLSRYNREYVAWLKSVNKFIEA